MFVRIFLLSKSYEHGFSTLASDQSHGRFLLAFEIPIGKDSVDLTFESNMQACCMCFGYDICSFMKWKNEGSVDVVAWAYVNLHGFTVIAESLETLETLRIVFRDSDRFIFVLSHERDDRESSENRCWIELSVANVETRFSSSFDLRGVDFEGLCYPFRCIDDPLLVVQLPRTVFGVGKVRCIKSSHSRIACID